MAPTRACTGGAESTKKRDRHQRARPARARHVRRRRRFASPSRARARLTGCLNRQLVRKMLFRERAPRARLQVSLEACRHRFVGERHHHVQPPRTMPRRLRTAPGVVVVESPSQVRGQPHIETGNRVGVPEHIDETFVSSHADTRSKRDARRDCRNQAGTRVPSNSGRSSCQLRMPRWWKLLPAVRESGAEASDETARPSRATYRRAGRVILQPYRTSLTCVAG